MGWDCYTNTKPIARKEYDCQASDWIENGDVINQGVLSISEYRQIIKARRNKYKILKGQRYYKIEGKFDGEFTVFRAIPELNDICYKHNLYEY